MRFKSGGKNVEIKDGTVYVDGQKVDEQPESTGGPTVITDASGPIHVGNGDQHNHWHW